MDDAAAGAGAAPSVARLRTVLICHEGAVLHREGLARWLAARSHLVGIVVLREGRATLWRRVRRQLRRTGLLRFADVLAFRLYYRLRLRAADRRWEADALARLRARYPELPADVPVLVQESPNSAESERFLRERRPDVVLALCKQLLKPGVFGIARHGTYALHPGICPEYRNAHGCFWALARGDLGKVGMTLLRIDEGIDTGPVYGYFTYPFDELRESHHVIQQRVTLDNLDAVWRRLEEAAAGAARPLDTRGRASGSWGQPWLTSYLAWQRAARRRHRAQGDRAAVS